VTERADHDLHAEVVDAAGDTRPRALLEVGTTASGDGATEQRPVGLHGLLGRRRLLVAAVFIVLSLVALYFLVPKLAGLHQTWGRLRRGDPLWLAVAAGMELLSIAGYAVLFRTVFGRGIPRLDWRASVQIPLAGIAAIRLFAAAGAGGVAVTAWALGRAGMEAHTIACRMVANLIVQYAVYLGAPEA